MKIKIGNKEVEGDYIGFDAKEEWTEILLVNGYRIRMKLVIASVFMSRATELATGVPLVNIMSTTVVSVLPPEKQEVLQ